MLTFSSLSFQFFVHTQQKQVYNLRMSMQLLSLNRLQKCTKLWALLELIIHQKIYLVTNFFQAAIRVFDLEFLTWSFWTPHNVPIIPRLFHKFKQIIVVKRIFINFTDWNFRRCLYLVTIIFLFGRNLQTEGMFLDPFNLKICVW